MLSPNHQRDSRALLLERMPRNSVCAEIGVYRGDFSEQILRVVRPAALHLIDPWTYQPGETYRDALYGGSKGVSQPHMDVVYESVRQRFTAAVQGDVVRLHRLPSNAAALQFADEYFDWIYIDGNHLYECVREDLALFSAKIKRGGYIAGDDYASQGWWHDGVRKAVDEFVANGHAAMTLIAGNQFLLQKPLKQTVSVFSLGPNAPSELPSPGSAAGIEPGAPDAVEASNSVNEHLPWCRCTPTMRQPLFLLAAPHSFSGLVAAMLSRHPQIAEIPATHLFRAATVAEWWRMCDHARFDMADGLLRAVAHLYLGEQTDSSIKAARAWLKRRSHLSTGLLFEVLAERVSPLMLLDKSPTLISEPGVLRRVLGAFPDAKFIHLVQHPRGYSEALIQSIHDSAKHGPAPYWMLHLASYPRPWAGTDATVKGCSGLDPQGAWFALNKRACAFFASIPEAQRMVLAGEDVLASPDQVLERVAVWLGLRTDVAAIEEMKHPERSPFACPGPPGARHGNERFFLRPPALPRARQDTVEGPLSWRTNGEEFQPKVKDLALQLGYQ
jgi:hypothetical protein